MIWTGKKVYNPLTDTWSTGYWVQDNRGKRIGIQEMQRAWLIMKMELLELLVMGIDCISKIDFRNYTLQSKVDLNRMRFIWLRY